MLPTSDSSVELDAPSDNSYNLVVLSVSGPGTYKLREYSRDLTTGDRRNYTVSLYGDTVHSVQEINKKTVYTDYPETYCRAEPIRPTLLPLQSPLLPQRRKFYTYKPKNTIKLS